jgi:transcriptional regulator with XRE-family HTH domain
MTMPGDKALEVLLKKYEEGRQKNTRWSKRAFAKRLGVSPGALSEIFSQKRSLSLKLRRKMAGKLELSPMEEADFFSVGLPSGQDESRIDYHILEEDQFRLISDWWYFAILNLVKTKGFRPSPIWIAKRLGITPKTATEAWERLFRTQHLEWSGKKVVRKYPRIGTSDETINLAARKSHLEDLKLAERSLNQVPLQWRDHSSMTLVIDRKDIQKAKEMIRLFQDKFAKEIHKESGDEVYKLSMALLPLSKIEEKS